MIMCVLFCSVLFCDDHVCSVNLFDSSVCVAALPPLLCCHQTLLCVLDSKCSCCQKRCPGPIQDPKKVMFTPKALSSVFSPTISPLGRHQTLSVLDSKCSLPNRCLILSCISALYTRQGPRLTLGSGLGNLTTFTPALRWC